MGWSPGVRKDDRAPTFSFNEDRFLTDKEFVTHGTFSR
jgi:hypothetical protein